MGVNRLAWLLVLWGAVVTAAPQQRVEPQVLSVSTDLVTLVVTVVDRRGTLIPGLGPEHFVVYDNGAAQTIQFFSSDDLPATIGLLIDCSASMRGRREQVIAAAATFAVMRGPADQFFALNFNERVWSALPPSAPFTTDNDQLRRSLSCGVPQGMTALYDAVDRGLSHLDRGSRDRKALIVVSDGGDNASAATLDGVLARARQSSAVIYSVTMFDPDNGEARPQVLRRLTGDTGGRAFTAGSPVEMIRAFTRIGQEIRSGYTIGFVQPDSADGAYRTLRVAVDGGKRRNLIARTRAGYYAGPHHTSID